MAITQERLIYTAGTIKLNDSIRQCRRLLVWCDVLRLPPSARYTNERSNPRKYFLGYVSLWVGDYVERVFPLEYESQLVLLWDNLHLQNYETILCTAANTQNTIQVLGAAMTPPAPIILIPNPIFTFPGCPYLWLKFKLEFGTRIKVTAFGEELESCPDIGVPDITLPEVPDTVPPYDPEVPRAEDPPRSDPEDGEQPGDTAPATVEDPDSSLPPVFDGTWQLEVTLGTGGTTILEYPGNPGDVFAIVSGVPGIDCGLSGASALTRNGSFIENPFNCNATGFVSELVSQTYVPG